MASYVTSTNWSAEKIREFANGNLEGKKIIAWDPRVTMLFNQILPKLIKETRILKQKVPVIVNGETHYINGVVISEEMPKKERDALVKKLGQVRVRCVSPAAYHNQLAGCALNLLQNKGLIKTA